MYLVSFGRIFGEDHVRMYLFCIRVRVEYAIRAHQQGSAVCCCLAVVRLRSAMSESNEPSPAATREPQQQSPSTSTSCILLWRRWRGSTLQSQRPRQLRSAFFRWQETPSPTNVHVWPTRTPKTSFSYTLTSICGSLQPTARPCYCLGNGAEAPVKIGSDSAGGRYLVATVVGGALSLSKGGVHFLAVSERCTYLLPVVSRSYCSCPLSLSFRFSWISCSFSCFVSCSFVSGLWRL